MADYRDQSAEMARLEKEIDRLDARGGDDLELRELRRRYHKLTQLQAIWLRKQKFPRLFKSLRAAVGTSEAQALVDALLTDVELPQRPQTPAKSEEEPPDRKV